MRCSTSPRKARWRTPRISTAVAFPQHVRDGQVAGSRARQRLGKKTYETFAYDQYGNITGYVDGADRGGGRGRGHDRLLAGSGGLYQQGQPDRRLWRGRPHAPPLRHLPDGHRQPARGGEVAGLGRLRRHGPHLRRLRQRQDRDRPGQRHRPALPEDLHLRSGRQHLCDHASPTASATARGPITTSASAPPRARPTSTTRSSPASTTRRAGPSPWLAPTSRARAASPSPWTTIRARHGALGAHRASRPQPGTNGHHRHRHLHRWLAARHPDQEELGAAHLRQRLDGRDERLGPRRLRRVRPRHPAILPHHRAPGADGHA